MHTWMDWATRALPALIPLLSLLLSAGQGEGKDRRRLAHDAAVVEKLPDGAARDAVLGLVERDAKVLADPDRRRDWGMLAVSLVVAPLSWYGAGWLVTQRTIWSVPLGVVVGAVAMLFTYGLFDSAQLRSRKGDDKSDAAPPAHPGGATCASH